MDTTIKEIVAQGPAFFRTSTAIDTVSLLSDWLCNPSNLSAMMADSRELMVSLLDSLATEALLQPGGYVPLSVALLQTIDMLCDHEAIKMMVARKWVLSALSFMGDTTSCKPFDLLRACASLLVNVVRLPECRSHLSDLSSLATCIRDNTDIYLQLQCLEIIYTVTKSNPKALTAISDVLGSRFTKLVENLPNNNKMLQQMVECLRSVSNQMCAIKVSSITCGTQGQKREGAIAHFGKKLVVLDWKEPDLTIPYELVRSIKLSRTKELVLRLTSVPIAMQRFFPKDSTNAPAEDSFIVSLGITDEEFRKLKDCNVQSWISKEMHNNTSSAALPSQAPIVAAPIEKRKLEPTAAMVPPPSPDPKRRASPQKENVAPPPRPVAPSVCVQAVPTTTASSCYPSSLPSSQHDFSREMDPLMSQLREIVTQRVTVRQQEGTEILAEAARKIQKEVDSLRARNAVHFNEYATLLESEMGKIRQEQTQLKSKMARLVERLNSDVSDMNMQNTNVCEHVTSLECEFKQVLEDFKRNQEDAVMVMNKKAEAELTHLDGKIHEAVVSSNPLRFVTQFLAKPNQRVMAEE